MDPTIVSGLIGALGIAGTAFGSRNARKAAEAAMKARTDDTRATLAAAREDRLWERRCAAYEEALTELLHRQMKRRQDLGAYPFDGASEHGLKDLFEGYDAPAFFESQGRLVAYASDAVIDAFWVVTKAYEEVRAAYAREVAFQEIAGLVQASGCLEGMPHQMTVSDARREVEQALANAEAAGGALMRLIRHELRSRPEAATLPAEVPAKRRRIWRRPRG